MNIEGKVELINKIASAFLGSDPDKLTGLNIFTDKNFRIYKEQISKYFEQVQKSKRGTVFEISFDYNKEKFWMLTNMQPVLDSAGNMSGVVIIGNNTTEQHDSQRELQKLQIAIEQSTASIVITDNKGIVEYANKRYCEQIGYTLKEILQKPDYTFSKENKKKANYEKMWEKLIHGEIWEGELENKNKSGLLYWEKVIISPVFDEAGSILNFISVKEDISDSKKVRDYEINSRREIEVLNTTSLEILKLRPEENIFKLIGDQLSQLIPNYYFLIGHYNPDSGKIINEYIHVDNKTLNLFYSKAKSTNFKIIR